MRNRAILSLFVVLSLVAAPANAQDAVDESPFTTQDALRVRSLQIQDVSPDGRWVALTVQSQGDRLNVDHYRFGDPTYVAPWLSELWVVDTRSGQHRSVFDEKVQVSEPTWSPEGGTLAFLLRRGDDFVVMTYDAARSRLRRVELGTDKAVASESELTWMPDGRGLLLGLRAEGWAEASRKAFLELTDGPVVVQDSREPFLAWDAVRNRGDLVIPALVDVRSGEVRELAPEGPVRDLTPAEGGGRVAYTVATPVKTTYDRNGGTSYEVRAVELPDGSIRTLMGATTERVRPVWNHRGDAFAYALDGDVWVRTVADSTPRQLTHGKEAKGEDDADGGGDDSTEPKDTTRLRFSLEGWSPDDARILVRSKAGLDVVDVASGSSERVHAFPEDEDAGPRLDVEGWSPDGSAIYLSYSARDHWERGLAKIDVEGHALETIHADARLYDQWSFSKDGETVLWEGSDGDHPGQLWVAGPSLESPRRLTDLDPWLERKKLTRSELVQYLSVDGDTLYGILYYPVDWEPGKRYPLVAEVYEDFFDNGFNTRMNLLANAGFFGFRPSVKFETGYPGEAWLKGVTTGINSLIERGLVDPDRLGVQGTSYGGYATNLLIAQTHRFAAAVNISGKVDIISFLGDSPKIGVRNYYAAESGQDRIGQTLWEAPLKYLNTSAVLFADRITTPLLLMTGGGDWNVPADNEREMYYALRRLGKEVVWVHYVQAGHGAGRSSTPDDFHDFWHRIISWYQDHFAEKTP